MASVASQLILHPVASRALKLLNTTLGRDKLYRAVQYFARFLAWFLLSREYKIEAARWNALKSHLALARKLLRLGKPLENLQAVLRALQTSGESGEQITTIGRHLGYFGYLTLDTLVWANAVKFFNLKPSTAEKVNKNANRFWFAGILFSITHSLLKAGRLANEIKKLQSSGSWGEKGAETDRDMKLQALRSAREATRYQFTLDMLDVWLPAANIGLVNFNDGILGLCGLITSLMALRQQWIAVSKN
ncbi:peroxisomal biogenesis factor [Obba rivulosa]|uniref:Peroxisomal biogenesis factor n=1 Tax=Obba rivulosa TaxID=1052685 RepID=A0A8E2J7G9_9APHY|nr:peroxisomal biogenesis factor [Obba rivulosa]